jgi:hypothetical protein
LIEHDRFRLLAAQAIDEPLIGDEKNGLADHVAACSACAAFAYSRGSPSHRGSVSV